MTNPSLVSASEPFVLRTASNGVVTLTLNRGDRYNPLSLNMIRALREELMVIAADTSTRVIVLAAAGKGFCAGHDLGEMRANAADETFTRQLFTECSALMMQLTQLRAPVIAQVHGIATAAGCQLVAMCDLAVAAENATFALPGVNIGVFCSTPGVAVVRAIGRKRTMEMLLTGKPVSAATALQWGLVNAVVAVDKLNEAVKNFTDTITARSPAAIALGKQAFYRQADLSLADAYQATITTMTDNCRCDDATEGMDAFLQKRVPVWQKN